MNIQVAHDKKYHSGSDGSGTILVVSSNDIDLNVLSHLLGDEGYTVLTATTGEEAIQKYDKFNPDLVLMDVILDKMGGYEAANIITQTSDESFIPIIFVSTLDSREVLVKALENGGVDLLSKPYNQSAIRSKIETFISLSRLYKSNVKQRNELEYHNKELTTNYEVATNVFDKVIHSDVLDISAIKYSISPVAIFNGDIILAAFRPSGEIQVMVGDFTGHGISAAIGAIPISEIFYGMTSKGFGISEILAEINSKMMRILPRGLFLVGCMFEFSPETGNLSIWNAGLPDALIFNSEKQQVVHQFASKNYPLGVSNDLSTTSMMDHYIVNEGDRILLFTDGVIETRNQNNEMYGIDGVVSELQGSQAHWVLDKLLLNMEKFSGTSLHDDDTTILELKFDKLDKPIQAQKSALPSPIVNSNWKLDFTFGASVLRATDPLPGLIQMVMEMQQLQRHKQDIFIIIKELFVNALDHGLLGLDSSLKQSPESFSKYILERQQRLNNLSHGEITLSLVHTSDEQGGKLMVMITDTGKGFDTSKINFEIQDGSMRHGRGIFMVHNICDTLTFNDKGNMVMASYLWHI